MSQDNQEVAISVQGIEPTRIKIDMARGILGMSRSDFIRNVIMITSVKRKRIYDQWEGKFIPIASNLALIQEEKKKKQYERFRQTISISKETYDLLKWFQNISKSQQSITITDIVESWLDDTVNSLFELFNRDINSLIESVLMVKRGEALEETNKYEFLMELLTGKINDNEEVNI